MKATNILAATTLSLALAAPAAAQIVMTGYDVDGDGELTGAEFRDLFDNVVTLSSYDTDGDGFLSEAEYEAGFGEAEVHFAELGYTGFTYTDWDLNSDGLVAQDEYTQGFMTIYDRDASGVIDANELTTIESDVNEGGIFGS